MNKVGMQVSFEGVRAQRHIAGLFRSGELFRVNMQVFVNTCTIGAFEIEVDPGIQRLPNINDGLGAKGDGQL